MGAPITVKIVIWCMLPAAISVNGMLRGGAIQPLFLCTAKKKPLAVKRKRQRRICVGTNSTFLILPAASGGQASSVPLLLLFPHESLRWIRVGAWPLCNPLKATKKGGCGPLSWIYPGVWFVQVLFSDLQNALKMRL